ncbi:glycosyltransferase family 4 protein [Catenuloplanes atrovinosus]|uniref:Glycosyltransferase involved in cell wall biosynthesis n=1 Tax=Catenuloplanes atrovinosus TaxID=137266 RepID=A0AAE4C9B6_9ACTN|nr:glycosyltransferase family 4 protein [Catenuloplanes atrovinosus]MDR7275607.1 glycosyltransferase involved in cell wall biosynthesis [Catenuloplanes atrovinosus]
MEIVQVAGFYPPHLGGEELVAQRLAEAQAERHSVTVYTSRTGDAPPVERHGNLRVVRDRAWHLGNTPVIPALTGRLLRHAPAPDVLHVHGGLAVLPEMVRYAARRRRVPYVVHVHLMVRPSSAAGRVLLAPYQRHLYARFLRAADAVICLSGAMRDELADTFGVDTTRITVVRNGVDRARFAPVPFAARATRTLLFVGRLTAQKDPLAAVEAMRGLPPDVTLRIAGDGELRDAIARRAAELGLRTVTLLGRLDADALAEEYRRATAVLMPSTHEGLPLVLLEALSTGAPVVCTALPELVEAGGDAVLAVRRDAFPGAVRALLDDPGRRAALSRAAERRAAQFSWEATTDAVERVYRRVRSDVVAR